MNNEELKSIRRIVQVAKLAGVTMEELAHTIVYLRNNSGVTVQQVMKNIRESLKE